jgi:hypothetical protein
VSATIDPIDIFRVALSIQHTLVFRIALPWSLRASQFVEDDPIADIAEAHQRPPSAALAGAKRRVEPSKEGRSIGGHRKPGNKQEDARVPEFQGVSLNSPV